MGTSSKLDRAGVVWLPGHSEGVACGGLEEECWGAADRWIEQGAAGVVWREFVQAGLKG